MVIRDWKGQIICPQLLFNGKCGHSPRSGGPVRLKDPGLSNAKTAVNNREAPDGVAASTLMSLENHENKRGSTLRPGIEKYNNSFKKLKNE